EAAPWHRKQHFQAFCEGSTVITTGRWCPSPESVSKNATTPVVNRLDAYFGGRGAADRCGSSSGSSPGLLGYSTGENSDCDWLNTSYRRQRRKSSGGVDMGDLSYSRTDRKDCGPGGVRGEERRWRGRGQGGGRSSRASQVGDSRHSSSTGAELLKVKKQSHQEGQSDNQCHHSGGAHHNPNTPKHFDCHWSGNSSGVKGDGALPDPSTPNLGAGGRCTGGQQSKRSKGR
ncbi:unnamed protein product, partial [Choristocarpus tenellus]